MSDELHPDFNPEDSEPEPEPDLRQQGMEQWAGDITFVTAMTALKGQIKPSVEHQAKYSAALVRLMAAAGIKIEQRPIILSPRDFHKQQAEMN